MDRNVGTDPWRTFPGFVRKAAGTVLGGTINFKDEHNGWMTNDEANHRFAFVSVPGLEDDPATKSSTTRCTTARSNTKGFPT